MEKSKLKKNQIVELEITDITSDGNGVGRYESMAVFVPETAVGDLLRVKIVKVLKSYCFGIVDEIISPSPDRVHTDCPHFPKCGGCSFRHISYESEAKLKEKFVYDAFTRIGKIQTEFMPVLSCEASDRYRNKAQYPVGISDEGNICGFYAKRSHRIMSGYDCRLLPENFGRISEFITEYTNKNNIRGYDEKNGSGVLRHIFIRQGYHSKELMICFVVKKDIAQRLMPLCERLKEKFEETKSIVMNINPDNTNVILGKRTVNLYGNGCISDTMCGNVIDIAPEAFYQVNTNQAERLYAQATEFAEFKGDELLLDLYCGAGTIGLSMADRVKKLVGVEIIPQAVENAKKNAEINGVENAEFICADAGMAAKQLAKKGLKPDVVVLDPPRKGCDADTLEAVVSMSPQKIVMISCNPATAARDCGVLCEKGYKAQKVRAVDLFPRTTHVECVVLMSRNKA
ncbi:MAG: 23S rRNA (uracil(1939)-C(5))-methyltransferase RlmD [Ruminococcus sp.]|nr:23S rRNA (uracil(1939)-C(5))-methyltransferase RlmD [Ruminococcus sp.]